MRATENEARLPDFVIAGAQKSGSTHLVECLRRHPSVYMPRGETKYFKDPEYTSGSIDEVTRAVAGAPAAARVVGIKCPEYLGHPEVPRRLWRDLDRPRLIFTLRNPATRAVSAYFWYMRWGVLPLVDAECGLWRILNGEYRDRYPMSSEVLDFGMYGRQLSGYFEVFPRDHVLVFTDEDLREASGPAVAAACSFLGVSPELVPGRLARASNPGIYSMRRLTWVNRRNKYVFKWDPLRQLVVMARPTRPLEFIVNAAIVTVDRQLLSRVYDNDAPQLSPELLSALRAYYADDVRLTEQLLGRDLSAWQPSPSVAPRPEPVRR